MGYQDAEAEINPYLEQNEQLLWAGRPAQGIRLRKSDVFMIPFSLMWGGFAIFWEVTALTGVIKSSDGEYSITAMIFPLFGIPFVLIGLYIMIGRFFVDAKLRKGTFYGVTEDRVIIVSRLFGKTISSFDLQTMPSISMNQKDDGSGNIVFGERSNMPSGFGKQRMSGTSHNVPTMFEMIDDVAHVYKVIRDSQQSNK